MDAPRTPREQAQANAKRKRRTVTRGGAARLHLLAEVARKRWRQLDGAGATPARDRRDDAG